MACLQYQSVQTMTELTGDIFDEASFSGAASGVTAEIFDEAIFCGAASGARPYIAYSLRLQRGERCWSVIRRFSQFEVLRLALEADGHAAGVPPLPPKGAWRVFALMCIAEHRRPALQGFLAACCADADLAAHAAFRSFIALPGAAASQTEGLDETTLTQRPDATAAARAEADSALGELAVAWASLAECDASIAALGAEADEARAAAAAADAVCARLRAHKEELLVQADGLRGAVRVYARIRPLTGVEDRSAAAHGAGAARAACVLAGASSTGLVRSVHVWSPSHADALAGVSDAPLSHTTSHEFERAFGPTHSDDDLFLELAPLARDAIAGGCATVLAYGQTGSGKTHSMRAASARMVGELFERTAADAGGLELWLSAVEVYNEALCDLLPKPPAPKHAAAAASPAPQLRHGAGVWRLEGLQQWGPLRSRQEGEVLIDLAHQRRATADNGVHSHSSRSHLVLQLSLRRAGGAFGQVSLCDLAGSERLGRTRAEGVRREEGVEINRALSALGDVVGALVAKAEHVPYRNSKLTTLLQPGMRRGCRVAMLVTASPAAIDAHETAAALAFASRAPPTSAPSPAGSPPRAPPRRASCKRRSVGRRRCGSSERRGARWRGSGRRTRSCAQSSRASPPPSASPSAPPAAPTPCPRRPSPSPRRRSPPWGRHGASRGCRRQAPTPKGFTNLEPRTPKPRGFRRRVNPNPEPAAAADCTDCCSLFVFANKQKRQC